MKPAELRDSTSPGVYRASVIIVSLLAFSVVFGFLILPIVQGRAAGLDAFTAICRAVGILPGSPAVQQPASEGKAQPTTQVAWSTELIGMLGQPRPAGAEVAQGCAACHGERGIAADRRTPISRVSPASRSTSSCTTTRAAAAYEVMTGIAQGLDDQQIVDVAGHFAASPEARARSHHGRGGRRGYRAPGGARRPGAQPSRLQLVPRGERGRADGDPDALASEQGVSRAAIARLQGRQPAQRHLHADAKRRRLADRPRDRKASELLRHHPQLLIAREAVWGCGPLRRSGTARVMPGDP